MSSTFKHPSSAQTYAMGLCSGIEIGVKYGRSEKIASGVAESVATDEFQFKINDDDRLQSVVEMCHTKNMENHATREEIDAKLAANVAEVKAVASDMRAGMTELRAENQTQFSAMRADMAEIRSLIGGMDKSLNAKIDGMEKSLGARIDGVEKGVEGKIDGLKTSVTTTQWLVAALLAVVAIVPVVTAIFSQPPAATPSPPAPIVITIPAQALPPATPSK